MRAYVYWLFHSILLGIIFLFKICLVQCVVVLCVVNFPTKINIYKL